jgi:hypothetical protein
MGDVSDLTKHPKYAYQGDPLALLEKKSPVGTSDNKSRFGKFFCVECTHRLDVRPWYLRWFFKARTEDYVCRVAPRVPIENSVTGERGYLPYGELHSSRTVLGPFHPCQLRNPTGNCRLFALRGPFLTDV